MTAEVREQHRWLQRLLGEWTSEIPGGPESTEPFRGTETGRSIGDVWVALENRGQGGCPGGESTTVMTLGYDAQQGRFVGTWIGSMMTYLWVYSGHLDEEGALVLEAEGPSMSGEGTAKYRDVIRFHSDDHRTLTSHTLGEDGTWTQFMPAHYPRAR